GAGLGARQLRPVRRTRLDAARDRRAREGRLREGDRRGDPGHRADHHHRLRRRLHRAASRVRVHGRRPHRVSAHARRRARRRDRGSDPAPGDRGPAQPPDPGDGMRIGLVLAQGKEAEQAALAESHGLFGVLAGRSGRLTAITSAVYASTATRHVRVGAWVELGLGHPVTVAEELSILDNVNNGRTFVIADTGDLDADAAADELAVVREALASLPLQHEGPHWKAPAGIPANVTAPKSISVTPKPVQVDMTFWVAGRAAGSVASKSGLTAVASSAHQKSNGRLVQPALEA